MFVKARQKQIKRSLCEMHIHGLFQPCGMILLPRSKECLGVWELPPFLSVLEALLKQMPERGQDSRLRRGRARGGGRACWSRHSGLWARTGAAPVCQLQALPFVRENLLHTFDLFNWKELMEKQSKPLPFEQQQKKHEKWMPGIFSRCSQHYLKDLMRCHV